MLQLFLHSSSHFTATQVTTWQRTLANLKHFNLVAMPHFATLNDYAQLTPFYIPSTLVSCASWLL